MWSANVHPKAHHTLKACSYPPRSRLGLLGEPAVRSGYRLFCLGRPEPTPPRPFLSPTQARELHGFLDFSASGAAEAVTVQQRSRFAFHGRPDPAVAAAVGI